MDEVASLRNVFLPESRLRVTIHDELDASGS